MATRRNFESMAYKYLHEGANRPTSRDIYRHDILHSGLNPFTYEFYLRLNLTNFNFLL
jgi:hypothetical protein